MKKLFTFFLLLFYVGSFAQQKNVDSLQKLIKSHTKADTVRVNLLTSYFDSAFPLKPDSSWQKTVDEILNISQSNRYQKGIALAHMYQGLMETYVYDNPVKSISHYQKSISIAGQIKSKDLQKWVDKLIASNCVNIATLYFNTEQYKKCLAYLKQNERILTKSKANAVINILNLYGMCYSRLQNHALAVTYYHKGIDAAKKANSIAYEANILNSLSYSLLQLKKNNEALAAANNSLALCNTYSIELVKPAVLANLSSINNVLKNYSLAEKQCNEAIKLTKEGGITSLQKDAYYTLYEIQMAQQKYEPAIRSYLKYHLLLDSIASGERKAELTRKEVEFEAEKKQTLANKEIKYQKTIRNYSIAGIGLLLAAGIASFIFYKKHRDSVQKNNELLYKAKSAETEMRLLRLQMNPHFIFNSLNSISDYIHKNDIEKADYYLTKFAKLMRGILENAEEKEITLAEEIKMLEAYMQLEASRLKHKFTYQINIGEDIDKESTYVPPLIMQPFIENSIWHGLAGKETDGEITIDISRNEDVLKCIIEDNGVGRKNSSSNKKSYGIKITNDRLSLLKNPKANIKISDLAQGTRVEINLPFETEA